jgi:putative transposase
MTRKPYATDLTDAQWQLVEPLIPAAKPGGRDRTTNMREVINAIQYFLRTGCGWRHLPHDFPPHGTVWWYYWSWRQDGTWVQIHDVLRQQVRTAAGRAATPSAGVIDSQSVKTTEKGGPKATTRPRKSRAGSARSWSTPSG